MENLERPMLKWLWLTLLVVVLDQFTKFLAGQLLQFHVPVELLPGLNLTLTHNTGAAFSFLSNAGGWQRWFFILLTAIVSMLIVFWLYRLSRQQRWMACALALILGGALGNLYALILLGYVIDFIDVSLRFLPWKLFNPWPAFNIADSAISCGAVMLIVDAVFFNRKENSGE